MRQWLTERNVPKLNLMLRSDSVEAQELRAVLGYSRDDVTFVSRRLDSPAG